MPRLLTSLVLSGAAASAGPLDYRAGPFPADVEETARLEERTEYVVRYPSPLKSGIEPNDTVWAHLSIPRGAGPFPCVVVLPVMAAPNIWIERRFIARLQSRGLAVLWLEMPYQFHRRPHASVPSGQVFLARSAPRLAFNFRQSVLDARRALEWLKAHPAIDPERIGLFGISLGAMVGAAVYSVDPQPRYAVFLLGGADFPSLVARSSMTGAFLRRAGISSSELGRAWKGIDPLDYKKGNRGKRAVLINVRSDTVIPAANALRLREAFPRSRQLWLPFGHYSAILHLLWIPRWVAKEFALNL